MRKDRAVGNLIAEGHDVMVPLFEFRNWLIRIRDLPEYRCSKRRNGMPGPGPFTLMARRQILEKLMQAQASSGRSLVSDEELELI